MIIGIVAKYAGRVSREPIFQEGVATVRWYGPDPEIFRRSSVRDVDRVCFHDDVVPLSYGEDSVRNIGNEISAILTNTNKDRIGLVWNDWHEIAAYDCDIVIINGEYERRIYRCVDKP